MKIAVTGASGKIGREVVRQLQARGHDTLSLDVRPPSEGTGPFQVIDLRAASQVRRAFDGMDAVCHLGEWPHLIAGHAETYQANTEIGSNVMTAARQMGVGRLIYTSTCQTYGYWGDYAKMLRLPAPPVPFTEEAPLRPTNGYALSKVSNENFARILVNDGSMPIAAFRFPFILTPQRAAWFAREAQAHQRDVPEGFGTYLYVQDAALAYCLALEVGWQGFEAFHFVADDVLYAGDMPQMLQRVWPDVQVPAGWPAEANPVLTTKAREKFGWRPAHSLIREFPEARVKLAQSA